MPKKRPAEELVEWFDNILLPFKDTTNRITDPSVTIPVPEVEEKRELARQLDARMRLEGSARSKHKKTKKAKKTTKKK